MHYLITPQKHGETYLSRFLIKVLASHPVHRVSLRYVGETVLKNDRKSTQQKMTWIYGRGKYIDFTHTCQVLSTTTIFCLLYSCIMHASVCISKCQLIQNTFSDMDFSSKHSQAILITVTGLFPLDKSDLKILQVAHHDGNPCY